MDAVEFTIIKAPQNILNGVGTPTEICRVPTEKVFAPIREQLRIVRRAPTTRDRIALEVDIDATLFCFFKQLRVSSLRILVRTRHGLVCQCLREAHQRQEYGYGS